MISCVRISLDTIKFRYYIYQRDITYVPNSKLNYLRISRIFSCADEESNEQKSYSNWTVVGDGMSSPVTKNVLTEFVGSTNCPYCPEQDELLLSYFDSGSENYVGSEITSNWFIINYHTYHPSMWDPMYLFLRGEAAEDDFCYIRFGNGYGTGSWYNISGVPTTYTNGAYSYVNPNMAVGPMAENTPVQLSLDGTSIDGVDVTVQVSINSVRNMSSSDSLHLFIAATLDDVRDAIGIIKDEVQFLNLSLIHI